MPHKVFWLEPTEQERVWLRRYRSKTISDSEGGVVERPGCPLPWGYHDHMILLKDRPYGLVGSINASSDPDRPSDDSPYWPTHCACGYAFQEDDPKQVFNMRLYRGAPDGQLYTLRDAPPGAMWDAEWFHDCEWMVGPDGIALMVKLPNGNDWCVDQEASNCTRTQWQPVEGQPNSRRWGGRTHYCWVRTGDPRTGNVHVGKDGNTCAAGAGSILSGNYHGFLHHGFLTDG